MQDVQGTGPVYFDFKNSYRCLCVGVSTHARVISFGTLTSFVNYLLNVLTTAHYRRFNAEWICEQNFVIVDVDSVVFLENIQYLYVARPMMENLNKSKDFTWNENQTKKKAIWENFVYDLKGPTTLMQGRNEN